MPELNERPRSFVISAHNGIMLPNNTCNANKNLTFGVK